MADTNQGLRSRKCTCRIASRMNGWLKTHLRNKEHISKSMFVEISKKFPSVMFLPLNGLIERIFGASNLLGREEPDFKLSPYQTIAWGAWGEKPLAIYDL